MRNTDAVLRPDRSAAVIAFDTYLPAVKIGEVVPVDGPGRPRPCVLNW